MEVWIMLHSITHPLHHIHCFQKLHKGGNQCSTPNGSSAYTWSRTCLPATGCRNCQSQLLGSLDGWSKEPSCCLFPNTLFASGLKLVDRQLPLFRECALYKGVFKPDVFDLLVQVCLCVFALVLKCMCCFSTVQSRFPSLQFGLPMSQLLSIV